MDDGLGGSFTEVNTANDPTVREIPYLNSFIISSFPASSVGKYFRVYLTAYSTEGSVDSGMITVQLASIPSAPTDRKSVV